jgi:hypothetical protein
MNKTVRRPCPGLFALVLLLPGCATGHLIRWSRGEDSTFSRPPATKDVYVRAGGTVLALPVTVVWDVATFPFQWIWDVYPYGGSLDPDGARDR